MPGPATTLRTLATLARWLGPWSRNDQVPRDVDRLEITVEPTDPEDRKLRAWLYLPRDRPAVGAYLLVPGIHYDGPADHRFDRFARVLAKAGIVTFLPFLPDYIELRADPRVVGDLVRSFATFEKRAEIPDNILPGIFSISFGSFPALRLAATKPFADRIGGLLLFGGYADWRDTAAFCLTGKIDGVPHGNADPLDQPLLFMNLIDCMPDAPADKEPLLEAWRLFITTTWGDPLMQEVENYEPVARKIAESLPEAQRNLFLQGCRMAPGAYEVAIDALERGEADWHQVDARPHLASLQCPVHLVHGIDDNVIPYTQLEKLREAMPPHVEVQTYLTRLYGHTQPEGLAGSLQRIPLVVREVPTMLRLLRAILTAATARRST